MVDYLTPNKISDIYSGLENMIFDLSLNYAYYYADGMYNMIISKKFKDNSKPEVIIKIKSEDKFYMISKAYIALYDYKKSR